MHTAFTYLPTKNELKQVVVFYGFVTNCTNDCKKKKYNFIKYVLKKKQKTKNKKHFIKLKCEVTGPGRMGLGFPSE